MTFWVGILMKWNKGIPNISAEMVGVNSFRADGGECPAISYIILFV